MLKKVVLTLIIAEEGEQTVVAANSKLSRLKDVWLLREAIPIGTKGVRERERELVRKTHLSSHDMAYLHEVVVYHVCQVIRWITVRLEQHLIVNSHMLNFHITVHQIRHTSITLVWNLNKEI